MKKSPISIPRTLSRNLRNLLKPGSLGNQLRARGDQSANLII
eukprot:UN27948